MCGVSLTLPRRRFLRARKFDIKNAKTMLANCQKWRQTVEGVGLDGLYDEIDPFDVSPSARSPVICFLIDF